MRVAELTTMIVRMPLRREIRHASAARRESENLLIRCRLADGTEGWGEGVPRLYVTGETAEGAVAQLAATPLGNQLDCDCQSWGDVFQLCDRFQPVIVGEDPRGCRANSLRCAVELSLLDAFGRLFRQPLASVAGCYEPAAPVRARHDRVRYSTTITAQGRGAEMISAAKMRLFGFAQCKVKVGVPGADDARRLGRIRLILGSRVDLRLDANEAWRAAELTARLAPLLPCRPSCLEQPVPHEELEALAALRPETPVPIMLDESLTSFHDAERAIRLGACNLFNIRISKCGGFLNSLRLAARARQAGIGYQLGCHPGESPILSAAGRHWAASVRDIRYLEGSYDRYLLRSIITREDVTFGYGGWAPALQAPGLGVTIDPTALAPLILREQGFPLR